MNTVINTLLEQWKKPSINVCSRYTPTSHGTLKLRIYSTMEAEVPNPMSDSMLTVTTRQGEPARCNRAVDSEINRSFGNFLCRGRVPFEPRNV